MLARRLSVLALALAVFPVSLVDAQEKQLRPGYLLCKAGGQLTFFVAPNVTDLFGEGAPKTARVHVNGHPSKKASMMVDGRFRTVTRGRKALEVGDCRKTT